MRKGKLKLACFSFPFFFFFFFLLKLISALSTFIFFVQRIKGFEMVWWDRLMWSQAEYTVIDLTLSVPQAVKRDSRSLTFCVPSRETRLANKRLECEFTIGR